MFSLHQRMLYMAVVGEAYYHYYVHIVAVKGLFKLYYTSYIHLVIVCMYFNISFLYLKQNNINLEQNQDNK